MQRIQSVTRVDLSIAKSMPPILLILAHGTVPTSGWSKPSLDPWFYIRMPDDRIQDFDFNAEEPTGMVTQVETPISAERSIARDPMNYWGNGQSLAGVRIHTKHNVMEAWFDSINAPEAMASDRWALAPSPDMTPVSAMIGKQPRVYKTGDMLTEDFRTDRANIELSPQTGLIVKVWFG